MANETRSVVVKFRAEMSGFETDLKKGAAAADRLTRNVDRSSGSVDKLIRRARNLALGAGLAKLAVDSVKLEAAFSKTLAQVAVATKAPVAEMDKLDKLALKLGADTVFSAQDAASAMLELAKGGLSPAEIRAGALANSLTLAAAGNLELGVAANSVVNTMGAFGLEAKDTGAAVAALAGAANASSADVGDITQALSQAGTEAHSAGLSVQETTAILAAFSNAGIKGSDAGTSLRTMLTRLVPQTDAQAGAMRKLGLSFTDANGEFVSGEQIAGRLQKAFKGMSAEERTSNLTTIFGADARRAANVLIKEGASGIRGYVKETSDLTAAQKLADASMSGTAGALEQLSGSLETAKVLIGRGLAPVIQDLAKNTSGFLEDAPIEQWATQSGQAIADLLVELGPLASSLFEIGRTAFPIVADAAKLTAEALGVGLEVVEAVVKAFNALPESAQKALILAAGAKTLSTRMSGLPGLAGASGTGILAFGNNAKAAGADSKTAAGSMKILGSALKANALLLGVAFVAPKVLGGLDALSNRLGQLADDSERYAGTFGRNGKATAATIDQLGFAFQRGNIGKYADDLGIDLDRLAQDMAKNGQEGEYYKTVIDSLGDSTALDRLGQTITSPFGADWAKADYVISALEDLNGELDGTHSRTTRLSEDFTNLSIDTLFAGGKTGYLAEQLKTLPQNVKTAVLTPGATDSISKVTALARKYKLTPAQVRTVMEADGSFAEKEIRKVISSLNKVEKKRTAKVKVETSDAIRDANRLQEALNRAAGNYYANFHYTQTGTPGRPSKASEKADGGAIRGPGGPREDLVPILASNGEHMVTAEEVDLLGGQAAMYRLRAQIRAGRRFANGGAIGRYATGGTVTTSGSSILNIDSLVAALNKLATGVQLQASAQARFDTFSDLKRSSSLDFVQQRQQIRDLSRDVGEKIKKGKHKGSFVLRGLDRQAAKLELSYAKQELATMTATNAQLKKYGTLKAEQARSEVAGSVGIDGLGSTGAIDRRLTQALSNIGEFTLVLSDLKRAGASPWLLDQLQQAGPTKTAIRIGRQYLADSKALQRINAQAGALQSVAGAYGMVAGGGTITSQQRNILVNIQALDVSSVTGEIVRQVRHELNTTAAGGGV